MGAKVLDGGGSRSPPIYGCCAAELRAAFCCRFDVCGCHSLISPVAGAPTAPNSRPIRFPGATVARMWTGCRCDRYRLCRARSMYVIYQCSGMQPELYIDELSIWKRFLVDSKPSGASRIEHNTHKKPPQLQPCNGRWLNGGGITRCDHPASPARD